MSSSTQPEVPVTCHRCGVDVHSHLVPETFPRYLGNRMPAEWPSMAPAHACHAHVMISDKIFRTVSDQCWSTTRRLADLPALGLSQQAISPMPELLSYWFEAEAGAQMARYLNDCIAAMVGESQDKLIGLGAVPLQDIDRAIEELRNLMAQPAFAGVEVGSNINGLAIGHARFDPFFEACEALGAAVFVHALKPAGMDRLVGPAPLQQVLAYPTDVGLAAASVITSNLIERRPGLRIAFSHGGGTLAMLLPRLEQARGVFAPLKESLRAAPSEQARKLYYDTLVFDEATLRHLLHCFGDTQLMIGTDYPFNFSEQRPVARIEAACANADMRERLAHGNALRFLGRVAQGVA